MAGLSEDATGNWVIVAQTHPGEARDGCRGREPHRRQKNSDLAGLWREQDSLRTAWKQARHLCTPLSFAAHSFQVLIRSNIHPYQFSRGDEQWHQEL
jgi:hypothetical protein